MKRSLFVLLALAVGLSGCTPAGAKPAPATAEQTATAETSGTATCPVGAVIRCEDSAGTPEGWYWFEDDPQEEVSRVLRLDYATGKSQCLYTFSKAGTEGQEGPLMVQEDAVQRIMGKVLYTIPLDGGTVQTQALEGEFQANYFDAYSAYEFLVGSLYPRATARRLDLATGQITDLSLPTQVEQLWAVGEDRLVLRRLVTEAPLPDFHQDTEQYGAALQTAVDEYDWYDPVTGALEKICDQPYEGAEQPDGTLNQRYFLGMAGDRLYFRNSHLPPETPEGKALEIRIESCTATGTDWQTVTVLPDGTQGGGAPFFQGASLRWIVDCSTDEMQIFDLADGRWYAVGPVPSDVGQPLALTGDGRVLLTNGLESDGESYRMTYALADMAAFLAGSTDWTPVGNAPAEPSA